MRDWAEGPIVQEYSLSADFDDQWRTGGTLEEIIEEAQLDADHISRGRSIASSPDREQRLRSLARSAGRI